jgi:lipoprotein-anchoring transpeptidase ErfK/SrfK
MKRTFVAAAAFLAILAFDTAKAGATTLMAQIDLSRQEMIVTHRGQVKYRWKVSTGRGSYRTPTGSYTPKWLSKYHRSRKYNNAPMPFSIFFHGGYAVHGTNEISRLGRPASHGCVRLDPKNAATLYSLVEREGFKNTRIIIVQ